MLGRSTEATVFMKRWKPSLAVGLIDTRPNETRNQLEPIVSRGPPNFKPSAGIRRTKNDYITGPKPAFEPAIPLQDSVRLIHHGPPNHSRSTWHGLQHSNAQGRNHLLSLGFTFHLIAGTQIRLC